MSRLRQCEPGEHNKYLELFNQTVMPYLKLRMDLEMAQKHCILIKNGKANRVTLWDAECKANAEMIDEIVFLIQRELLKGVNHGSIQSRALPRLRLPS